MNYAVLTDPEIDGIKKLILQCPILRAERPGFTDEELELIASNTNSEQASALLDAMDDKDFGDGSFSLVSTRAEDFLLDVVFFPADDFTGNMISVTVEREQNGKRTPVDLEAAGLIATVPAGKILDIHFDEGTLNIEGLSDGDEIELSI